MRYSGVVSFFRFRGGWMVLPEGCNTEWVVSQLDKFIRITDGKFVSGPGGEFDPMWDSDFDRDEILVEGGCGQFLGPT